LSKKVPANLIDNNRGGTSTLVKVAVMLLLPVLVVMVAACGDNGSSGGGAPTSAPTVARVPYQNSPEGKPPGLTGSVPDPKEAVETKPAGQLPDFIAAQTGSLSAKVTALYQGAVDHYDDYSHVPCYCGCAAYMTAHTSLASCYIQSKNADGSITFTAHSASCDICQGVAQMTLDGIAQGTPLKDVRSAVFDKFKYTKIWTDTPPVP
jgi:hypothetical protein